MGAADIVPGVSGGTVALVFGIYERLIASVKAGSSALGNILKADVKGFKHWLGVVDWKFILPLGFGVIAAIVSLAPIIEGLLETQSVLMAALFLGLVGGSMIIAWAMIRESQASHIWLALGVGALVFLALGLRGGSTADAVNQIADPALWAFFAAGALAICAMILPGISGSFILVLLGMYGPVLSAVTDRDMATLAVFAIGTIVGLAVFSQILHRALLHHHDVVVAGLVGLMGGSLRVLWPWPNGVFSSQLARPDGDLLPAILIAAGAFAVVIVVARFAQRLERLDHPVSTSG